ncbi:hypothetical protein MSG28_008924 [Choristoneura fumiferana]|uniref:Uncharacterized protein n=1 Tax=Choristoneura fumiferana TaxID=7141 RepID=A0ACC0J8T1_CHOFU|nr:hypothetical protein MSG28_008924 [Choristoneura fumiferana]
MKLFVVAAVLGVCAAGRLDNTYLPPGSRGSGGSGFGGNFGSAAGGTSVEPALDREDTAVDSAKEPVDTAVDSVKELVDIAVDSVKAPVDKPVDSHEETVLVSGKVVQEVLDNTVVLALGFQTQHAGNIYNAPNQYQSTRQQNSADANAQILRSNSEVTADGFAFDFETSNGIRADASGVATNGVQSHGSFGYKGDDGQDYSITYTADENGYQPQGAHLPTPPPIPEAILKSLEQNARDEAAGISDDGSYNGEGAGSGYSGQSYSGAGQYSGGQQPSNQYGAPSGGFQSPKSNFGAASRQYLAPKAGPNGSGNFNSRTGYQY